MGNVGFHQGCNGSPTLCYNFRGTRNSIIVAVSTSLRSDPSRVPRLCEVVARSNCSLMSKCGRGHCSPLSGAVPAGLFGTATHTISNVGGLRSFGYKLGTCHHSIMGGVRMCNRVRHCVPCLTGGTNFPGVTRGMMRRRTQGFNGAGFNKLGHFFGNCLSLVAL